jgi:uncharacterized membrane protein YfcA
LTLFSGFGLGTVLMPVFALFFPVPVAIGATAVVHLANNLFKASLIGYQAERKTVLTFGVPAAVASAAGASLLHVFSVLPALFSYELLHMRCEVTVTGLVIGCIVILSVIVERLTHVSLAFHRRYLIPGGLLSGFFGGLSGYQGILRSAFLIKTDLNKGQYIATGVICSIMVDTVRIIIYGWSAYTEQFASLPGDMAWIVGAASISAFLGAYVGSRYMKAITLTQLRALVSFMLILLGGAIAIGISSTS